MITINQSIPFWRTYTYTAFPQYAVPDYKVANGSKGWATYQSLLKAGWTEGATALFKGVFGNREFRS
jgi:hypothetical protein